MADLEKPITTQEEFDAAIKERLEREDKKVRAEYADYETIKESNTKLTADVEKANKDLKDAQTKVAEHETTIEGLNAKVKQYERDSAKTKAALAAGLPADMASRLQGETEDDLKKDAENLAKIFGEKKKTAPLKAYDSEGTGGSKEEKREHVN